MSDQSRIAWGKVIETFIKCGWNPPTPTVDQAHRILDAINVSKVQIGLSPREKQFLQDMADGLTRPEIADKYGISQETVKTRLDSARHRLGASNGPHAVAIGMRLGILDNQQQEEAA